MTGRNNCNARRVSKVKNMLYYLKQDFDLLGTLNNDVEDRAMVFLFPKYDRFSCQLKINVYGICRRIFT